MIERSTVRIADLCDLIRDSVKPRTRPDALYLGLEHLAPRRLVRIGGGQASEMRSTTSAFEPGDVLYGKLRPYLDKAVLADDAGVCTTELLVLRPRSDIDERFLSTVLHSPDFLEYAVAGTTGVQHPRTSWAHIREFEIPATLLDEQHRIADLLWLVHHAINQSEKLIEEGQALKRATMHTLFTRGLRGEAQKETEIGPVPENWKMLVFHQFVSLKRGYDLPISKRRRGAVPVFGSNGKIGFHDRLPTAIPVPGVMVGRSGSVGKVSFSDGEYWPHNTTLYVEHFNGNYEKFVQYFLERFDFSRFASGVSVPTLNRNSFAGVYVAVPSLSEQREIADVLQAIDRKIDLHRRKLAILDELFKALSHKLMTGEIEVGELNHSVAMDT